MIRKTLSLPEELFNRLKVIKGKNETIPELLSRLLDEEEKHTSTHYIEDLEGAFGDDSDEWDVIEQIIYEER